MRSESTRASETGIDEALEIVRILLGEDEAQRAQLFNQYVPHPPVRAGDPCTAPARVLAEVDDILHDLIQKRRTQIIRILRHEDSPPGS